MAISATSAATSVARSVTVFVRATNWLGLGLVLGVGLLLLSRP